MNPRTAVLAATTAVLAFFVSGGMPLLADPLDPAMRLEGVGRIERAPLPGVAPLDAERTPLPVAPTAPAPTTSSTAPPTTVAPRTTAPPTIAPPTTAVPPTPPPTQPAPPPAPEASAPPGESGQQRAERALVDGVPGAWRANVASRIEVIDGGTSWARGDGLIMISRQHASGRYEHLVDVVAHEFGHLIAFEHGSRAYAGASPEGWPEPPHRPEEAWADCVQTVFTGRTNPSHGLAPCGGEQLSWAANWLRQPPA